MDFVEWKNVTITGGFWKAVCDVNRKHTIPHISYVSGKRLSGSLSARMASG